MNLRHQLNQTFAKGGRWLGLSVVALAAIGVTMSSCGKVRNLPVDKPITLLNGNLQETRNFDMLDTLYVQVAGLTPDGSYTVEALDPSNQLISSMTLQADAQGVIAPAPLWYDVGLRKTAAGSSTAQPDTGGSLSLNAFHIHVTGSDGTDYTEPFYIVYSNNNVGQQPRPVVWATSSATRDSGFDNTFEETGTVDGTGAKGKTAVYVEARHLPASINGTAVSSVDVYVVPAKGPGEVWQTGDTLTDKYVARRMGVAVTSDGSGAMEFANPVLVWDLDNPLTPLINPGESNNAYDVIVDVNQNGVFDLGDDVNGDGVTDRYVDGVDGQGVVGFIVANTPANDFFATVTDASSAQTDTLLDGSVAGYSNTLSLALNNVPPGSAPVLHLYQHLTTTDAITPINLTLQPVDATHPLPFVNATTFADTAGATIVPTGVTTGTTVAYDLTVTGIGSTNYTKTIRVMHPAAQVIPSNGTADTELFDETGTTSGNTKVYARTAGLALTPGVTVALYAVPHAATWSDGTILGSYVAKTTTTVPAGGNLNPVLLWDLDVAPQLKNPTAANNAYDLILDIGNDGVYNAASDYVDSLGFVVRDTSANNLANLIFANIASGGIYRGQDYDYRDIFRADGLDTKNNYYVRYGIKAIWNPYVRYSWQSPATDTPSIYYGQRVDVYIVNADTADLSAGAALGTGGNADVSGGAETLSVQYSCYNGSGQQNIWLPRFTPGRYFVIVDMNRNGVLDEGVDLVDAVRKDGTTLKDDPTVVGFTVQ